MAALAAAYRTVGFEVRVLDVEGRKGHLLVTLPPGGTYRVDVLKEPLNHPVVWMEFGPVISSRSGLVNPARNWPNVITCPGGDIAASTPRQSIKIAAFRLSLRAASLTAPAARQQATTAESRACGSTICVRGTTPQ